MTTSMERGGGYKEEPLLLHLGVFVLLATRIHSTLSIRPPPPLRAYSPVDFQLLLFLPPFSFHMQQQLFLPFVFFFCCYSAIFLPTVSLSFFFILISFVIPIPSTPPADFPTYPYSSGQHPLLDLLPYTIASAPFSPMFPHCHSFTVGGDNFFQWRPASTLSCGRDLMSRQGRRNCFGGH